MANKERFKAIIGEIAAGLAKKSISDRLSDKLLEVELPQKWRSRPQDRSFSLCWDSPEVTLRLDTLQRFNEEKKIPKKSVTVAGKDAYIEDFFKFLYDKISTEIYDYPDQDASEPCTSDDFLRTTVLEVAVLRKIQDSKLSVISFSGEEFCIKVEESFPGLGIDIVCGDVLRVFKPKKDDGEQVPELVGCCHIEEENAKQFLENLKNSSTILEDFLRCLAVWEYILDNKSLASTELKRMEYCESILQVCDEVQTLHSKLPELSRQFWSSFKDSKFFHEVLPMEVEENLGKKPEGDKRTVLDFVKNIIYVVPTCGIKAKDILLKLCLKPSQENMEFLFKCLGGAVENVEGAKDDEKSLKRNQKPLIPSSCELISSETNWKTLPKMKVTNPKKKDGPCKYKSEDEYLNTNHTLLREECFYNLKEGVGKYYKERKLDCKSVMLYRIRLERASKDNHRPRQGLSFKLAYEFAKRDDNAEQDPDNSRWLMCNNLLCIFLDLTFRKPIWATVANTPQKDREELFKNKQVYVTFCTERNSLSDAEIITKLQKLNDQGRQAYMFESNTFYVAFGPPLDILQSLEHVPFKEQIVDVEKCTGSPPDYLKNIKKRPDWGIIFELNPYDGQECIQYSHEKLLEEFRELVKQSDTSKPFLDEKQLKAVEQALCNRVTLIQGPPGTGKSFVGVRLLRLLLSILGKDDGPILVATYKNFALDHFLDEGREQIPNFSSMLVRVGSGGDKENELESCRLYNLRDGKKRDLEWKLERQLDVMRPEIQRLFKQLMCHKYSDIPHIFIKEADDKHLKALIGDEFDKLIRSTRNFREKKYKELRSLIKEPLEKWLPSKEEFLGETQREQDFSNSSISLQRWNSGIDANDTEIERCIDPSDESNERFNAFDDDVESDQDDDSMVGEDESVENGQDWTLPDISEERLGDWKSMLNAGDIKELNYREKIHLVYALKMQYFKAVSERFCQLAEDISKKYRMLKELRSQRDIEILNKRRVIGMTVSGAAMRANWLEVIRPSVMIIEEAAEILEPQLVSIISSSVQHLIMIGDQQQLRPQVSYYKLHRNCNLGTSMFERLVLGGLDCTQLSLQGRMTNEIAHLVRLLGIYDEYKTRPQSTVVNRPACLPHPMFFYSHSYKEDQDKYSNSKLNHKEAEKVIQFAAYLCKNNVDASKITILCSYLAQVTYLKMLRSKSPQVDLWQIAITTIDSFQGKENDIIILSLVRSGQGKDAKIGYLSSVNRICVAVSRARCGIYFFGNEYLLQKNSSKWKKIIEDLKKKGYLGNVDKSSPFPMVETVEHDGPVANHPPMQPSQDSSAQPNGRSTIHIQNCENVVVQAGDGNTLNINQAGDDLEAPAADATVQQDVQPPLPPSLPQPVPSPQGTPRQQENQQTQTAASPTAQETSSHQEIPHSDPDTTVESTEETRKSDGPEPLPQEHSDLQRPPEVSNNEPTEMSFHDPSLQGGHGVMEQEILDADQRHLHQDTNPPSGQPVQEEGRISAPGTNNQREITGTSGVVVQEEDSAVGTSVQEEKSNRAFQETELKETPERETVQDTNPNTKKE